MVCWRRFCLVVPLVLGAVSAAVQPIEAGEPRTALVIGNATYQSAPLRNPVNDARAMARTLTGMGFDVLIHENANEKTLKQAIGEFGDRLRKGGVGLFYYSGHGMQVKGNNYLVPVDADIRSEAQVGLGAVNVNDVLGQMEEARNRINIVILDACRDNPFARRFRTAARGLASIDAPKGTLIAYATAPGSVADDGPGANGLYTEELLRAMSVPDRKIEDIFKQVRVGVSQRSGSKQIPWESTSLSDDFYFAGGERRDPGPAGPERRAEPQPRQADRQAIELAFWNSIPKDAADPDLFREYLRKYPGGEFVVIARSRLKELERPSAPVSPPTGSTMPNVAARSLNEERDFGVRPQSTFRLDNFHSPTPTSVPGAVTITTPQLQGLLTTARRPLLIDVLGTGPGHPTIPDSVWMPMAGTGEGFHDPIQRELYNVLSKLTQSDRTFPLVFFCLGYDCWLSYNATLRALRLGYRRVYWYRGGVRAWEEAGLPTQTAVQALW